MSSADTGQAALFGATDLSSAASGVPAGTFDPAASDAALTGDGFGWLATLLPQPKLPVCETCGQATTLPPAAPVLWACPACHPQEASASSAASGAAPLEAVSLFGGIGGFDLACQRAGIRVRAAVEIDPGCRGVLARHFPATTLFDDVTEVTGDQLLATGFVPGRGILTAGFPCQDLSVAGRRAGLGGARSGLFWQIVRLAAAMRPRWLVLENVVGLLSAACFCEGDETCVANGRADRCGRWDKRHGRRVFVPHVPHTPKGGACRGGCMELHGGAMGTVLGALGNLGYGFAYRVLDAQYFGLAQRRQRVLIVCCLGDWAAPVEVLLEPESGTGHSAAGAQPRPRVAGTLAASAGSGGLGGAGQSANAITSRIVETVASTLQGGGRRGYRIDAEGAAGGHLIPFDAAQITSAENRSRPQPDGPSPTLNGSGQVHVAETAYARTSHHGRNDREETYIAVPVAVRGRAEGGQIEARADGDPAFTVRTPGGGSSYPMVAQTLTSGSAGDGVSNPGRRREDDHNLVAHALTAEGADASEDGTGRGTPLVAVPVAWRGRGVEVGEANIANAIRSGGDGHIGDQMGYVMAFNPQTGGLKARLGYGETPTALQASQVTGVHTATAVRRLTPRECERLQGFPDDWTRWLADGSEQSDSARYRQLGNAVAVPVAAWITKRLAAAEARRAGQPADRGAA